MLSSIVYADSPLTSIDLTEGNEKDEMVQYAKASGGDFDDKLLDFCSMITTRLTEDLL